MRRTDTPSRPLHLRARWLGLVFAGGVIGTALRVGLSVVLPDIARAPAAIFAVNIVGAFCLAVLLDSLARRGPDAGIRRVLRLGVGTGLLGSFTTYSALSTDTARLLSSSHAVTGIIYALATVLCGLGATYAGFAAAAALTSTRGRSRT